MVALVEMIESEFAFLVDMGFDCVVEGDNAVRYERNEEVFVRIFRDPQDKYVGFRVGLTSRPRDALTAAELARLSGAAASHGEFPGRVDELSASVARVAQQLRAHGERALSGDTTVYDEAMELRRAYTKRFTNE